MLRTHRTSRSAEPSDRAWHRGTRTSGPRAGLKIWRSLAVVSPVRNLRTGRGGAGSLDAGGLGGRNQPAVRAPAGSVATSRDDAQKLHADDTPVPVLAPGFGKDKNRTTVDVCARRSASGRPDTTAVWFAYSPDRKGEHPKAHLSQFEERCRRMVTRGSIRSTKQGAFRKRPAGRMCAGSFTICRSPTNLRSPPKRWNESEHCMRSKRDPGTLAGRTSRDPRHTQPAVARIAETMAGRNLGQAFQKIGHGGGGSLRTGTMGSVDALLRRWAAGDRQQRGGTRVARCGSRQKKLLFAGSDRGGESAAAIYSLIGTAKLNGLDPESYLRNVLSRHRRTSDQPHRRTASVESPR